MKKKKKATKKKALCYGCDYFDDDRYKKETIHICAHPAFPDTMAICVSSIEIFYPTPPFCPLPQEEKRSLEKEIRYEESHRPAEDMI